MNHLADLKQLGTSMILPVFGLLGVISYLFGTMLSGQIHQLAKSADRIASEEPGLTIAAHGSDEFAQESQSLNDMSQSLAVAYRELQDRAEQYKQHSSYLAERDKMKTAMLSTALDAIITIDEYDVVCDFNEAAETLFGFSLEEVIGQEMAELIVPEKYREPHRKGMKHWQESGEGPVLGFRIEIEAQNKQGQEFPIELAITPFIHYWQPFSSDSGFHISVVLSLHADPHELLIPAGIQFNCLFCNFCKGIDCCYRFCYITFEAHRFNDT